MNSYREELIKQKNYDDIMYLPHSVSQKYPHMSMENRAAQFQPFSALAGYEDAVDKTIDEHLKKMTQQK